jgi:hypothetical protein
MTVLPYDADLRKACRDLTIALTDGEFRYISGAELFEELKSFHAFYVTPDMPRRPLDALKYFLEVFFLLRVSKFEDFTADSTHITRVSGKWRKKFLTPEAYQEIFSLHDGTEPVE